MFSVLAHAHQVAQSKRGALAKGDKVFVGGKVAKVLKVFGATVRVLVEGASVPEVVPMAAVFP